MGKRKGRHPINALTDRQVKTLKTPGIHADGNCLYLRVDDNGNKAWIMRLVIRGERKSIGLGSARLATLAEAREKAHAFRKAARTGGDPLAERNAERCAKAPVATFEEVARQLHETKKEGWRNKKHAAEWIATLERFAFPKLGRMLVSEISSKSSRRGAGGRCLRSRRPVQRG
jgi:Arm domain-containing DNA-binding protein/integrase-like protein